MSPEMTDILDDCLERIGRGESLESCVARYPQHRDELSGILTLAAAVAEAPVPAASAASVQNGRRQWMAHVRGTAQAPVSESLFSRYARHIFTRLTGKENPDMRLLTRIALAALMAVFGVLTIGGTMAASAQAIPGDLLYPVKTTLQDVRMILAPAPLLHDRIESDIQATRQADVQRVLDIRRIADVRYSGELAAIDDRSWTVGGHALLLLPETEILGRPYLGATISVIGRTRDDGTIVAVSLVVDPAHDIPPDALLHFAGELTRFNRETWVVGGHTLVIVPETHIAGEPFLGATVEVTAHRTDRDALVALALVVQPHDRPDGIHFSGPLTAMDDRSWTIGDRLVYLVAETEIVGEPYLGAVIHVTARLADDGRLISVKLIVERGDGELVRFYGLLSEFTESKWVVAGRVVHILPETVILGEPHPGAVVWVIAKQRGDSLAGVQLAVRRGDIPDRDIIRFSGRLIEFSETAWLVGDHRILIVPDTRIIGEPIEGAFVHVWALPTDDGALIGVVLVVVRSDAPPDHAVHFTGPLTAITDRGWTVAGHLVKIVPETQIVGRPHIGAQVEVFAWRGQDGTLVGHKLVVLRRDLPPDVPPGEETDGPPTDPAGPPPAGETDFPPPEDTDAFPPADSDPTFPERPDLPSDPAGRPEGGELPS